MKLIEQLRELLRTEIELAEALMSVMRQQQRAIIYSDYDALHQLGLRQQELLVPLESLETERMHLVKSIMEECGWQQPEEQGTPVTLSELLNNPNLPDAEEILRLGKKLRDAAQRVVALNEENGRLLSHTQNYIRESIRILTENYSRNIVDKKL